MNKLKIPLMMIIFIATILTLSNKANAGVSISTSKSTVKPGESFTVTVSVNNAAGKVSASVSNGSGGFSSVWLENGSKSFTCKAGNSGNVEIKTSGTVADFSTEKDESASRTKTVKIQNQEKAKTTSTKSTKKTTEATNKTEEKKEETEENNEEEKTYSLAELKIDNAELKPDFQKDTLEYELNVEDQKELNVIAKATDDNTIVEVTGNDNLKIGDNYITITLKGQDDKEIVTYKVKVNNQKSKLTLANEQILELQQKNTKLKILCFALAIVVILVSTILIIKIVVKHKNKE
jgi:hypothetical protein